MVPLLTSPTLLQNSTFVVVAKRTSNGARFDKPDIISELYFCSCSVKQKRISNGVRFDKPRHYCRIFYFCSCSVKQNGHQMVPLLTSPTLLQNSTLVVVV